MSDELETISQQLQRLRDLNISLRRWLEQAEAQIPVINEALARLEPLRFYPCDVFLGQVIHQQPYYEGPEDSCIVIVATAIYSQGFGATFWDLDEYQTFRSQQSQPKQEVDLRFVPFDQLAPGIKALLMPQVGRLLGRICREVTPPGLQPPSAGSSDEPASE